MELSQIALGNMIGAFTIFMSLVSGYLIVAYLIGSRLTRSQLWFVNALFLVTTVLMSLRCVRRSTAGARAPRG